MIDAGERLAWPAAPIVDKHSVGGLPGNRTTLVVVPIVTAAGLTMPKTSSRAITSPAGTADTMETLAPVALDLATMRRVVEREGRLHRLGWRARPQPRGRHPDPGRAPARARRRGTARGLGGIEEGRRRLDRCRHRPPRRRDGQGAKRRGRRKRSARTWWRSPPQFGLRAEVVVTDGSQPVGRGLGPALEARDVLAVLRGEPAAPPDLRERALVLAGHVLELSPRVARRRRAHARRGHARRRARVAEVSGHLCGAGRHAGAPARGAHAAHPGAAFGAHCRDRQPPSRTGREARRRADRPGGGSRAARRRSAGRVEAGEPLFTLHAESPGELDYALAFVRAHPDIVADRGVCVRPLVPRRFPATRLAAALSRRVSTPSSGARACAPFPDGESYVRIEGEVSRPRRRPRLHARPSRTRRRFRCSCSRRPRATSAAARVGLVAPYLAYLRQDRRFLPGEGRHLGLLRATPLAAPSTGWSRSTRTSTATRPLAELYCDPGTRAPRRSGRSRRGSARHVPDAVLIGPDVESAQWVGAIAAEAGVPHLVLEKVRRGDRDGRRLASRGSGAWRGRTPVLVDDIISTGRTMLATIAHLRRLGARAPVCIGVHAVFAGARTTSSSPRGPLAWSPATRSRTPRTRSTSATCWPAPCARWLDG